MEIAQLFFSRYEDLRSAMDSLVACPEAEWRARPHGLNPITWLVWHMARAEDSGLNRLVFDQPQVLDDPVAEWPTRMRIPLRHHGSTMPSDEVDALNAQADFGALWAYFVAVAERTRTLVGQLDPASLGETVPLPHLRRVLFDEGMLRPGYAWPAEPPLYSGALRGELLLMFGVTHNFYHWGELLTVHSCLASPHHLSPA
ncbi:MAG: DinB family protein [Thermomicrobiales bacterium]